MIKLILYIFSLLPMAVFAQVDSNTIVDQSLRDAIMNFDGKRYEMALKQLNTSIDYNTRNEVADVLFYYRALTHLQLKNSDLALKDFNLAIASIENEQLEKPHYYLNRAELLYLNQDFENTKSDLTKVINSASKKEEKSRAYTLLGTLEQRNNKGSIALDYFNKAVELNDSNADAFYYRAFVYYELMQPQTACANLSKAVALGHQLAATALNTYCKQ